MSERLAATFEFYYIQPLGLRNLRLGDAARVFKRARDLMTSKHRHQDVLVKNFIFIPSTCRCFNLINVPLLRSQLRHLLNEETVVWITSPSDIYPSLLSNFKYRALVYEMLDDYAAIHAARKNKILATELWLIEKADLIITTSSLLRDKANRINPGKKTVLISNGVDYAFFNKTTPERPSELSDMKTVIGYIGSVDTWLDTETIEFLADARKDYHFIFIGPVKIGNAPLRENIHYLGRKDYDLVPHYINHFDACLIPFKKGDFADTINPVKLYEYFALGKPVVAYHMKELAPYIDCMFLADDKTDFLDKLDSAIAEKNTSMRDKRKEIARLNDWSVKSGMIEDIFYRL